WQHQPVAAVLDFPQGDQGRQRRKTPDSFPALKRRFMTDSPHRPSPGWVPLVVSLVAVITAAASWNRRVPTRGVAFEETVENGPRAPGPPPAGMGWIPGGEFWMGAQDPPEMNEVGMRATADSRPIHRVYVDGFFMDSVDVTNADFERFTAATAYMTVAER